MEVTQTPLYLIKCASIVDVLVFVYQKLLLVLKKHQFQIYDFIIWPKINK